MNKYIDEVIAEFAAKFPYAAVEWDGKGGSRDIFNEIRDFLTTALKEQERRIKEDIAAKIKEIKAGLVVDNFEDGKVKNCNPRCHDSGKEDALNKIRDLLTPLP